MCLVKSMTNSIWELAIFSWKESSGARSLILVCVSSGRGIPRHMRDILLSSIVEFVCSSKNSKCLEEFCSVAISSLSTLTIATVWEPYLPQLLAYLRYESSSTTLCEAIISVYTQLLKDGDMVPQDLDSIVPLLYCQDLVPCIVSMLQTCVTRCGALIGSEVIFEYSAIDLVTYSRITEPGLEGVISGKRRRSPNSKTSYQAFVIVWSVLYKLIAQLKYGTNSLHSFRIHYVLLSAAKVFPESFLFKHVLNSTLRVLYRFETDLNVHPVAESMSIFEFFITNIFDILTTHKSLLHSEDMSLLYRLVCLPWISSQLGQSSMLSVQACLCRFKDIPHDIGLNHLIGTVRESLRPELQVSSVYELPSFLQVISCTDERSRIGALIVRELTFVLGSPCTLLLEAVATTIGRIVSVLSPRDKPPISIFWDFFKLAEGETMPHFISSMSSIIRFCDIRSKRLELQPLVLECLFHTNIRIQKDTLELFDVLMSSGAFNSIFDYEESSSMVSFLSKIHGRAQQIYNVTTIETIFKVISHLYVKSSAQSERHVLLMTLLEYFVSDGNSIMALALQQIRWIAATLGCTTYNLIDMHSQHFIPVFLDCYDNRVYMIIANTFLDRSFSDFVRTNVPVVLPILAVKGKERLLNRLAYVCGYSLLDLVVNNLHSILKPILLYSSDPKTHPSFIFLSNGILKEYSLFEQIKSCKENLLIELVNSLGHNDRVLQALWVVKCADNDSLSLIYDTPELTDISSFLAVYFMESLDRLYNRIMEHSSIPKIVEESTQSIVCLIRITGTRVSAFVPKILACIRRLCSSVVSKSYICLIVNEFIRALSPKQLGRCISQVLVLLSPFDSVITLQSDIERIYSYIFVELKDDLAAYLSELIFFPKYAKLLGETEDAMDPRKLHLHFRKVSEMMLHESAFMRIISVDQLCILIDIYAREFETLVREEAFFHTISDVISTLLRFLSGTDYILQLSSLKALGYIGAIDVSNIHMPWKDQKFAPTSDSKLAIRIIRDYLVHGLNSTSDSVLQNKILFSIQELLITLGCRDLHLVEQYETYVYNGLDPSSVSLKYRPIVVSWHALGEDARNVISPCLESNLSIRKPEHTRFSSPLYHQNIPHMEWLSSWCRQLILMVPEGSRSSLFDCCWSVIKYRSDLSSFLLPYIVESVIRNVNSTQLDSIGLEMTTVLHMALQESFKDVKSVEQVFKVLDAVSVLRTQELDVMGSKSRSLYLQHLCLLQSAIPHSTIATVAFKCNSAMRALRSLEIHLRKSREEMGVSWFEYSNNWFAWFRDGLADSNLGFLRRIYTDLSDCDMIVGINRIRPAKLAEDKASFYQNTRQWEEALICTQHLLEQHPRDSMFHSQYLKCLSELGHFHTIYGNSSSECDMSPYTLEACWKLGHWDSLDSNLEKITVPTFESRISSILACIKTNGKLSSCIRPLIEQTREELLRPCVGASLETFRKVYPYFVKLHQLRDLELMCFSNYEVSDILTKRLERSQPDFSIREQLLSTRRVVSQVCQNNPDSGYCFLRISAEARISRRFDYALSSLLNAESSGFKNTKLEHSRLLRARHDLPEALCLLQECLNDTSEGPSRAEISLLHAEWVQESGLKKSGAVIQHYKNLLKSDPNNERGCYLLGSYYDEVFRSSLRQGRLDSIEDDSRKQSSKLSAQHLRFLHPIIKHYVKAALFGHEYIYQCLPRVVSLWVSYSEAWSKYVNDSGSSRGLEITIHGLYANLQVYKWFAVLPQCVSLLGANGELGYEFIHSVLFKVLLDFPRETVWTVGVVSLFNNPMRRSRAIRVIDTVKSQASPGSIDALNQALGLFEDLARLCSFKLTPKTTTTTLKKLCPQIATRSPYNVLIPTQSSLSPCFPLDSNVKASEFRAFSDDQVTIEAFDETVEVLRSKERPKKIQILGSDGKWYRFLIKKEVDSDIRKDSRMMELNSVVNRLFIKDPETRKRNLRLRTFSVVPLKEQCGIIEWVPKTLGFRQAYFKQMARKSKSYSNSDVKKVYDSCPSKTKAYQTLCSRYPPLLHDWLLDTFSQPISWFEARSVYTRSCATWSMVGHLVGLGDRHCENILLDRTNGECVHVDFDCMFDAGLYLSEPERVPFRLTNNMVDAMGLSGYEGTFRICSEHALRVLRDKRDILMNVLDSFVHDPLVNKATPDHPDIVMKRVQNRLQGVVSIDSLPLGVEGHVQYLIEEATSLTNLAAMYIWWLPWI